MRLEARSTSNDVAALYWVGDSTMRMGTIDDLSGAGISGSLSVWLAGSDPVDDAVTLDVVLSDGSSGSNVEVAWSDGETGDFEPGVYRAVLTTVQDDEEKTYPVCGALHFSICEAI